MATLTLDLRWLNWRSNALLHTNWLQRITFYTFTDFKVNIKCTYTQKILFLPFLCSLLILSRSRRQVFSAKRSTDSLSTSNDVFCVFLSSFISFLIDAQYARASSSLFHCVFLLRKDTKYKRKAKKKKINTKVCCKVCCKSKYTSAASSSSSTMSLSLVLAHEPPAELCLCESYLYLYCYRYYHCCVSLAYSCVYVVRAVPAASSRVDPSRVCIHFCVALWSSTTSICHGHLFTYTTKCSCIHLHWISLLFLSHLALSLSPSSVPRFFSSLSQSADKYTYTLQWLQWLCGALGMFSTVRPTVVPHFYFPFFSIHIVSHASQLTLYAAN